MDRNTFITMKIANKLEHLRRFQNEHKVYDQSKFFNLTEACKAILIKYVSATSSCQMHITF
jgi:hypothetical protein